MLIHPEITDIPALKSLWKEIFADTDEYIELFFENKFDIARCFIIKENDAICSMLHYFDVILTDGKNEYKGAYICGIATLPEMRGKSFAGKLLEACVAMLKEQKYDLALLIPATASLFGYYKKFGFSEFSGISIHTVSCEGRNKSSENTLTVKRSSEDIKLLDACYGKPILKNGIFYYKTGKNEYTALEYTEFSTSGDNRRFITAYNPEIESSRDFTMSLLFRDIDFPRKKYINLLLN